MAIRLTTAGRVAMELVKTKNTYMLFKLLQHQKKKKEFDIKVLLWQSKQALRMLCVVHAKIMRHGICTNLPASFLVTVLAAQVMRQIIQSIDSFWKIQTPHKNHNGIDWNSKKNGA